jgi:hypothetical protein
MWENSFGFQGKTQETSAKSIVVDEEPAKRVPYANELPVSTL